MSILTLQDSRLRGEGGGAKTIPGPPSKKEKGKSREKGGKEEDFLMKPLAFRAREGRKMEGAATNPLPLQKPTRSPPPSSPFLGVCSGLFSPFKTSPPPFAVFILHISLLHLFCEKKIMLVCHMWYCTNCMKEGVSFNWHLVTCLSLLSVVYTLLSVCLSSPVVLKKNLRTCR